MCKYGYIRFYRRPKLIFDPLSARYFGIFRSRFFRPGEEVIFHTREIPEIAQLCHLRDLYKMGSNVLSQKFDFFVWFVGFFQRFEVTYNPNLT